ncbi:hypothetical protein HYH03_015296 [Edaphochlamys debaryana]|uniref:Uncharacterized protein n=1 Tax=Edaphochlamys debaryana TaxID=47281 RepID=A0A835XKW5_9CHLO|nr:hypothetical protein HYH03_015296 [Edaphochlamys debaryana]|eukprot:KAG2485973.1 hypothetical protein HYH03_015296 [Edaphochlamys debaryana]
MADMLAPGGLLSTFLASPLEARQRIAALSVKLKSSSSQAAWEFPVEAVCQLFAALPALHTVSLQAASLREHERSSLFAALASLPKLRDLTFTGDGCGMLGNGVGPLAGSTQLTRLCVKEEGYTGPSILYNYEYSGTRLDDVLRSVKQLGSVRELVLRTYPGALHSTDLKGKLPGLPSSVRRLDVSPLRCCGKGHSDQNWSVCFGLCLDFDTRALTLRAEDGGSMCAQTLGWLLQPFAIRGELTSVRLAGSYQAYDNFTLRRPVVPGLGTVRQLRSQVQSFKLEHMEFWLRPGRDAQRGPDLGALMRAVEALGVPEDLTLQDGGNRWELSLRSPHPPPPLGQGGGGGAISEDGSWGGSEAEPQSAAEALARLWVRSAQPRGRDARGPRGCVVLLSGPPLAPLLRDDAALGAALERLQRAAAAAQRAQHAPQPTAADREGGDGADGEPLLGQPLLRSFAALPAAGVLLVDCSSEPAAECAAAAAAAQGMFSTGFDGAEAGPCAPAAGEQVQAVLLGGDCRLRSGSLLGVSAVATSQVLQAAWDGADPGLGFEERLGAVLGARETLAGIQLDVKSLNG